MKTSLDANTLLSSAQQVPGKPSANANKKVLKKSCQDFEALFLQSVFKAMRKNVPESDLFKKNNATSMFEEMLDQELASTMARTQSIGIADQMYRQMEKNLNSKK
jgi:flagellar protein FlgJ